MEDLGRPIAYLALEEGTPVYDRSGDRVGVVKEVVADEPMDIFEGLIIHAAPLPGRHLFAHPDQVAEMHERGVLLSVNRSELQRPHDRSAARRTDNTVQSTLQTRLRRVWDWISGRG